MIINNLAGGEVEITDIKRFLGGTEYDISDIYFGDKHIFESWRELESPLPITILAAGEDLIDYRIYGNTESGESAGERTENLVDVSQIQPVGSYQSGRYAFECDEDTTYTFLSSMFMQGVYVYGNADYSSDRIAVAFSAKKISFYTGARSTVYIQFALASVSDDYRTANLMLTEGSTAPASYIPYGFKLPMGVSGNVHTDIDKGLYGYTIRANNSSIQELATWWVSDYIPVVEGATYTGVKTGQELLLYSEIGGTATGATGLRNGIIIPQGTHFMKMNALIDDLNKFTVSVEYPSTPIYIGDTPLGEDEYVDFGEQKVYRRTEQLFNAETAAYKNGFYKKDDGFEGQYPNAGYYKTYIPITPGETIYVINVSGTEDLTVRLYFYNAQKQWISRTIGYVGAFSVVTPSNAAYAQLQISPQFISSPNTITITQGSTVPSTYIPYLQPTDPPAPIPALPTIQGETIIDYNPSTTPAVEPEKMYIKYKPQ